MNIWPQMPKVSKSPRPSPKLIKENTSSSKQVPLQSGLYRPINWPRSDPSQVSPY